jgi:NAD(P)-dependent dehydrogenase (short-subunit alcohol dehydrogenase family)
LSLHVFGDVSVIVTGGAVGLGAATVRRLHADGLSVVIADVAEKAGAVLAAELGERAAFACTDEASVSAAIDAAERLAPLRYAVIAHGGSGVLERTVGRDGTPASQAGFE